MGSDQSSGNLAGTRVGALWWGTVLNSNQFLHTHGHKQKGNSPRIPQELSLDEKGSGGRIPQKGGREFLVPRNSEVTRFQGKKEPKMEMHNLDTEHISKVCVCVCV